MEERNSASNDLLPRLYRSINVNYPLFQDSKQSSKSLLPRIVWQHRNKSMYDAGNTTNLTISNGKILLNSSSSKILPDKGGKIVTEGIESAFLFSKENSMNEGQLTQNFELGNQSSIMKHNETLNFTASFMEDSILKQDLDSTIKVVDEEKRKSYKRRKTTKKKAKDPKFGLSSWDFISLIQNDPDMEDEFCYFNKRDDAYDYTIVDYEDHNPKDYLTISSRGVTIFRDGEVEFCTLEDWMRDAKLFSRVKSIEFFKDYKLWKGFYMWKKLTRRNMMRNCSHLLSQQLFYLDKNLRRPLIEIQSICLHISKLEFADFSFNDAKEVEEFRSHQENYRVSVLDKKIETFENGIRDIVSTCCQSSLLAFKEENRIPIKEGLGNDAEENVPLLVGDESNREMPYTQEATIRTHYKKLKRLIKLFDFLLMDSKVWMIEHTMDMMLRTMLEHNDLIRGVIKKRMEIRLSNWILVSLGNEGNTLIFDPTVVTCQALLEEIINKSVLRICHKHKYLSNSPEFLPYTATGEEEGNEDTDDAIDMQTMIYSKDGFKSPFDSIKKELGFAFENLIKHASSLEKYLYWWHENVNTDPNATALKDLTMMKETMNRLLEQDSQFQEIEIRQELGLVVLDCQSFKEKVKNSANSLLKSFEVILPKTLQAKTDAFLKKISETNQSLNLSFGEKASAASFIEGFVHFVEKCNAVGERMDSLTNENSDISGLSFLLLEFKIKTSESLKGKINEASQNLQALRRRLDEAGASYDQNLNKCKRKFDKLIPDLNEKLTQTGEKIGNIPTGSKDAEVVSIVENLDFVGNELEELVTISTKVQKWQQFLQLEVSKFEKLEDLHSEYLMLRKLWIGRKELMLFIKEISGQQFTKVDLEKFSTLVEKLTKASNHCVKELELNDVSRVFKAEVEEAKGLLVLLQSLRDPVLEEKQWQEIRFYIASDDDPEPMKDLESEEYTIDYILKKGIQSYSNEIQNIVLIATKEADLNKMMDNIEVFWKAATLTVNTYKDQADWYILGNNDEFISKIDDTLLTLDTILGSRYVEGLRGRVELQVKMFRYLQELLDEWILHQGKWIYLQPVLTTSSSHLGLAKEAKMFATADSAWKKLMKKARDTSIAKFWADDYASRGYFNLLRTNNQNFDLIEKALEDYLEKKREHFHRFFFLSSDELLEILSTTKAPIDIQSHIKKCFENIAKLEFESKDSAVAMLSPEGERVELKNYLARGEVEEWFRLLEDQMKSSLKLVMRQSHHSYGLEETERPEWIFSNPCQVVIAVDSIYWTRITEDYLLMEEEADMEECYQVNVAQLEELTQLIRKKLTPIQRKTLVALITQDVHYRDIVEQLCQENVTSLSHFRWQTQLRYYWDDEGFTAKQLNAVLSYGYEYLGATSRLVITPLTDRCWITITSALNIHLGANPQGPAGTGKTESCKDLAKSLGRNCIVFNCSDQINSKMMEKLFTGLCYTGAWVCLDEFNRIDIEVLSVIAQQLLIIREALSEDSKQFTFFTKSILLNSNMGVFITMNPGYAGRTELPDNLKVLFRPVSMMVPNYALIAEIMLFAEGYENAKVLAIKMTKLYKLCSEQLSQQIHYDFGMRAVKSILVMAGNLKRASPDSPEDMLLITAMCNSNVPKFLVQDIPLFYAIIKDLFPGTVIPELEDQELQSKVRNILAEEFKSDSPAFMEKILQLHETLNVRFGVMVLGPSLTGKSTLIKTLHKTYDSLALDKNPETADILELTKLNPKSIEMEELYGEFDILTQTWTDGLASKIIRDFVSKEGMHKKWVIFDGPVDSLWIENMNSVLDDSMTLCLSNGERIKLNSTLKMLFEVQDLNEASPATVSRCGMVFLDSTALDFRVFFECYLLATLSDLLNEMQRQSLSNQVTSILEKCFVWRRKRGKEGFPISPVCTVQAITRIISSLLSEKVKGKMKKLNGEQIKKAFDKIVLFSVAWGVAGPLSNRELFEAQITECFHNFEHPKGSIFQNLLTFENKNEGEFLHWLEIMPEFSFNPEISYFELFVPTMETTCYSNLLKMAVNNRIPLYFTGTSGTGKTAIVLANLLSFSESGEYLTGSMSLSAQSQSSDVQSSIEGKMQSQRRNKKIILIPPPGKHFVFFVDDINMPSKEQYGAQPPIELLRQVIDQGGFYDRAGLFWKEVENTTIIAASGLPGGGRSVLTERFTSHFNIVCLQSPSESTLKTIFGAIFGGFLRSKTFKTDIVTLAENESIVNATLSMYFEISQRLLPTPEKVHYTFNLRDVSKVFQGMLQAKPDVFHSTEAFVKLWTHEITRVFHDRLINDKDQKWFFEELARIIFMNFKLDWSQDHMSKFIFVDYMRKNLGEEQRMYEEVTDYNKMLKVIRESMMEDTKLNLTLFSDAVSHMNRITRVLRQEKGHFMIVGLGGSGKKSLVELASALASSTTKTIESRKNFGKKDFREQLFSFMSLAGITDKAITFLLLDTVITDESFIEDINSLLNSGEVHGLIQKEQLEEINNSLLEKAYEKGKPDSYSLFLENLKKNLHIVLSMSPIGNSLRTRMMRFPSIVNCCTIDWLGPWPEEALYSVSKMYLQSSEDVKFSPEEEESLANFFVFVQKNVLQVSLDFFNQLRRNVYLTPKSYINLVELYKELFTLKKMEISSSRNKLINGLTKLSDANKTIDSLSEKLVELQPILKQKTEELEVMIGKLEKDKYEANFVKVAVQEEETVVSEKANIIKNMKNEADKILEEAMPTLDAAFEALNTLNRNDISEIKSQHNLHPMVKFTLECVAILLEEKSDWDSIKKILADPNFLSKMKSMNVYEVPPATCAKIKNKLKGNPNFQPAEFKQINLAAKSMCEWIIGVSSFQDVWKEIEKKKTHVESMNNELKEANDILTQKQHELSKIIQKVNELENKYKESKKEKDNLDNEIDTTSKRLSRAKDLNTGLADEQIRWRESAESLEADLDLVIGNVLVSAAAIAYFGPFTLKFREEMIEKFVEKARELELPFSENFSFVNVMGNPVEIQDWNTKGLPFDSVSVANGIILKYSKAYPLLIDPQKQGSKWLKNLYAKKNLVVLKSNSDHLLKSLEMCIRIGDPVLIEDLGETLDSALDPLLNKDFKIIKNRKLLKLGDSEIEYDDNFKLFFVTKLSNPHYIPEIFIRVSIINFTVTQDGLEEQLLAEIVKRENPDVESMRVELVLSIAEDKGNLKRNEDRILDLLSNSKKMILDDEELIASLQESKATSAAVKEKLAEAEEKQKFVVEAREVYKRVAIRGSLMFFVICDLAIIDPMYQFSLAYFSKLFNSVIEKAEKIEEIEQHLKNLIDSTTKYIFINVCRGLFNAHKGIFAFLLAAALEKKENKFPKIMWNVFISSAPGNFKAQETSPEYISEKSWLVISYLASENERYTKLKSSLSSKPGMWKNFLELENPESQEKSEIAEFDILSVFEKIVIIQVLRPERTLFCMNEYVRRILGPLFLSLDPPKLEQVYEDTDDVTPLIFILSPGADPLSSIIRFSRDQKMGSDKIFMLSLGQGQGVHAEKAIDNASKNGGWVILQNCHLGKSFLPELEKKLEVLIEMKEAESLNESFRLILTSTPCSYFPVSILQNGVKLTNEPPNGVRSNMVKTFNELSVEVFSKSHQDLPRLTFSLAFFHAIIHERRKFGSLGWNIPYEFNESDFETSLVMKKSLIESSESIPWESLLYLIGEINYGGRVTDDNDRRLLNTILKQFLNSDNLKKPCVFPDAPSFSFPADGGSHEEFKIHVEAFPLSDPPTIFGLHPNATVAYFLKEGINSLELLTSLEPKESTATTADSSNSDILGVCNNFLEKIPPLLLFDSSKVPEIEGTQGLIDSLEICMMQECERFNKLLKKIRFSINQLIRAISGEELMSAELENMLYSIKLNKVPDIWTFVAYPSMKKLGSWFEDLLERVDFFKKWQEQGKPKSYWLSAFFFPQGFLTSILQNYSRKTNFPIDALGFSFDFKASTSSFISSSDNYLIHGLFLEGCKFNTSAGVLEESEVGVMHTESPSIVFIPKNKSEEDYDAEKIYKMPVYKTLQRSGVLSSTGMSTNFIIYVETPTKKPPSHWILSSAAMFCALND